ncbi:MAG: citryl-CoA lyase [Acidimicrobiia bacterium]
MSSASNETETTVADWWSTAITEILPGVIRYRGYPVEELIGHVGFVDMISLLVLGDFPTEPRRRLLEAALVASVDHGPQAPSIASARMAATTGVGLNSAIANGVNVLGDVHGGAGEQAMELFLAIDRGAPMDTALAGVGRFIPGFGHRFHPVDPRVEPLLVMVEAAREAGVVSGRFVSIARSIEDTIARPGRRIPMNIDGVTAVVFCELDVPPPLGRGLFVLSRAVGILAHAWEETVAPSRLKGPMPPSIVPTYTGPTLRHLDEASGDSRG